MKKLVLTFSTMAFLAGCNVKQEVDVPAINRDNFDESVALNDDFYQYATGGWQTANPLKPEFARYGTFDQLRETNEIRLNDLFSDIAKSKNKPGTVDQKIADLYNMGMDSVLYFCGCIVLARYNYAVEYFVSLTISALPN